MGWDITHIIHRKIQKFYFIILFKFIFSLLPYLIFNLPKVEKKKEIDEDKEEKTKKKKKGKKKKEKSGDKKKLVFIYFIFRI